MIEMCISKGDRFATPKALSALTIILLLRLLVGEKAFGSAPAVVGDTLLSSIAIRISGVILLAFVRIKAMEFTLRLCHFWFVFTMVIKAALARQIKMVFSVAFLTGSGFIGVCLRPLALVFAGADLAPRGQAIGVIATPGKEIGCRWLKLSALRANLKQGQLSGHSASLSLYLRLLSAGGEIDRRSGATLADKQIIPQLRAKC